MSTRCLLLLASLVSTSAFAQWHGYPTPGIPRTPDGKPNLSAPAPRAQDGKPDLSGIWLSSRPSFNVAQSLKEGDTIPFQPWARQVFEERQANHSKDDPSARCLPTGPTQKPTLVTPFKIVQIPGLNGVASVGFCVGPVGRQRALGTSLEWFAWRSSNTCLAHG